MTLSEAQISYVRDQVEKEGIDDPGLKNDLIDHICCAIEANLVRPADFEAVFNKVFTDFCSGQSLKELGAEIHNISNYTHTLMKKIALSLVFGFSILFFLFMLLNGIGLANQYNWPFMEGIAFFNQYGLCLFLLPLYWFHQYRLAYKTGLAGLSTNFTRLMYILGFLCSEAVANAVFFKLMQMPGGNQLFMIAAILGIGYAPLYVYNQFRMEMGK
ncbi:hypothetical protein GXP67_08520 [Rhodocytophaga rosea]|uniref:Uncharacterized protein n=1 Tax=Rhodocytophaga rosea TaxID=2704465 RepID=A0A6C0GFF6_9BACT|nr:hypothetical protein [Rhodocytophaga rosea]QHT66698.1 hypothetical protein GXP67_08520 [Rhodocytophaga rosea]